MSGTPDIARPASPKHAMAEHFRGRVQFNIDWITRPLFGFLLAGVAVGATILGGLAFAALLLIGTTAAIREWHRLFAPRDFIAPTVISVSAVAAALFSQLYITGDAPDFVRLLPLGLLVAGAVANAALGAVRQESSLAHAGGPIYIGLPTLSLLILRQAPNHPVWLVVLTFLAVWATDTGAMLSGNLIGGPKLAPVLSPNKTWAGAVGGAACAVLIAASLALILHTAVVAAAVFGFVLSVAGQFGDLFESFIKRRVGKKDTGGLIPGHGGVLDRIDSVLFAAPVAAFVVLVLGVDPLSGLS